MMKKILQFVDSLRDTSSLSREMIVSLRGLVVLYRAGIPVSRALGVMSLQAEHPKLKSAFLDCRRRLEEGKSIAKTIEVYPDIFPELYVRLIETGEKTGKLEQMLEKIASHAEKRLEKAMKLRSALVYPAFMLIMCLGFLIFGPAFILRGILDFLKGLSIPLPPTTRFLIAASTYARAPLFWIVLIFLTIGAFIGFRRLMKERSIRRYIQFFLLSVPGLGALLRQAEIATFASTISTVYDSGLPLLQGIELAKKSTTIIIFQESLDYVLQRVTEGEPLKDALAATGIFPAVFLQLLAAGEQSGEIVKMLDWAAKICEQNLEQSISTFIELLQPLILIFVGVIVGFLLIATLAPMLRVVNGLG